MDDSSIAAFTGVSPSPQPPHRLAISVAPHDLRGGAVSLGALSGGSTASLGWGGFIPGQGMITRGAPSGRGPHPSGGQGLALGLGAECAAASPVAVRSLSQSAAVSSWLTGADSLAAALVAAAAALESGCVEELRLPRLLAFCRNAGDDPTAEVVLGRGRSGRVVEMEMLPQPCGVALPSMPTLSQQLTALTFSSSGATNTAGGRTSESVFVPQPGPGSPPPASCFFQAVPSPHGSAPGGPEVQLPPPSAAPTPFIRPPALVSIASPGQAASVTEAVVSGEVSIFAPARRPTPPAVVPTGSTASPPLKQARSESPGGRGAQGRGEALRDPLSPQSGAHRKRSVSYRHDVSQEADGVDLSGSATRRRQARLSESGRTTVATTSRSSLASGAGPTRGVPDDAAGMEMSGLMETGPPGRQYHSASTASLGMGFTPLLPRGRSRFSSAASGGAAASTRPEHPDHPGASERAARVVAKVMHITDREQQLQAAAELRVLAAVAAAGDPSLAVSQCRGVFAHDGDLAVVLEYSGPTTLQTALTRTALSAQERRALLPLTLTPTPGQDAQVMVAMSKVLRRIDVTRRALRGVVRALAFLHEMAGAAHNDVKGSNVVVDIDETPAAEEDSADPEHPAVSSDGRCALSTRIVFTSATLVDFGLATPIIAPSDSDTTAGPATAPSPGQRESTPGPGGAPTPGVAVDLAPRMEDAAACDPHRVEEDPLPPSSLAAVVTPATPVSSNAPSPAAPNPLLRPRTLSGGTCDFFSGSAGSAVAMTPGAAPLLDSPTTATSVSQAAHMWRRGSGQPSSAPTDGALSDSALCDGFSPPGALSPGGVSTFTLDAPSAAAGRLSSGETGPNGVINGCGPPLLSVPEGGASPAPGLTAAQLLLTSPSTMTRVSPVSTLPPTPAPAAGRPLPGAAAEVEEPFPAAPAGAPCPTMQPLPAAGGEVTLPPGSALYMAPERLRGAAGSAATDIWALGITLVMCLTAGQHPVPEAAAATTTEARYWHMCSATDDEALFKGQGLRSRTLALIEAEGAALFTSPGQPSPGASAERQRVAAAQHQGQVEVRGAADFVARCLEPDPSARASAAELSRHPWLMATEA